MRDEGGESRREAAGSGDHGGLKHETTPRSRPPHPYRGRFAPSPTGNLHLGNARTALLAWLHCRASEGVFVLRIEDLDRNRVRRGLAAEQLEELRWLGLDWDEGPDVGGEQGPYVQSERTALYESAIERLHRSGAVYPCVCTRREIAEAASAPHGPGTEGPRYPGFCRPDGPGRPDPLPAGRPEALRFRVRAGRVCFDDLLHGRRCFDPDAEVGDFLVRRKDGVAAYQLACVVDDGAMGMTDVVRGDDLLPSTARQLLLYDALRLDPPRFLHVPLMHGHDGERLSKREGATTLSELRETGEDPRAVVGWLAWTCGIAEREARAEPRSLVSGFDPSRLPRSSTAVDRVPFGRPSTKAKGGAS